MAFDLSWKRLRALKPETALVLVRTLSLAIWVAAAAVLGRTAIRYRQTPARLASRMHDWTAVAEMDRTAAARRDAEAAYRRDMTGRRPFDWTAQAAALAAPDRPVSVQETLRESLGGGVDRVRIGLEGEGMALAALSGLLEAAESADPPWRLRGMTIEPLPPRPGLGRVRLECETVAPAAGTAAPP